MKHLAISYFDRNQALRTALFHHVDKRGVFYLVNSDGIFKVDILNIRKSSLLLLA